ncbi:MAG: 3-phosphoshikimate 1-carboxyvinyltransferase [Coriobacteriaceae bacterium]|nr:3-phosphoshikimate 1-carboxyvinyltransferase [Coriobacteriaceae bacterium]
MRVPGDKSLSHRAVLFAAMAEGTSVLTGVLDSADVRATIAAVSALGARVEGDIGAVLRVTGWGADGPSTPAGRIDCGNSGTTARLLMGVLAGWPVQVTLTGDDSLSQRPMARVTEPLARMGATFETAEGGTLPVTMRGGALIGIDYESPVASAQIKSAVLLAGLRARGRTIVTEPAPSRDHTERLLPEFGIEVGREPELDLCWVEGPAVPLACDYAVPADPSSAAFPLGAALIVPGSEVVCTGVLLNPTRIGFLLVLARMGADVLAEITQRDSAEFVGDITARFGREMEATLIEPDEVPSLIDEVPLLAVVATQAHGTTRFEGVGELRVKESDRLQAVADALTEMGAIVRSGADWLEVDGPCALRGAALDSLGDHRLAMAYAVAGRACDGEMSIERFEAVDVSWPGFGEALAL